MSRYYTIQAIAEHHGVHRATVYRWLENGYLNPIWHKGRLLVSETEVLAFQRPTAGRPSGSHGNHGGSQTMVPKEDIPELYETYIRGDATLEELGDIYGVTRERIRQLLKLHQPGASQVRHVNRMAKKKALKEERDAARLKAMMEVALETDAHCVVCGAWVLRNPPTKNAQHKTCSAECAKAWPIIRTVDNYERHQLDMAKSAINHPERHKRSTVRRAEEILSGDIPIQNRSYVVPGSVRSEMVRKFRPEAYRYMTCKCPNPRCSVTCVAHVHTGRASRCNECGTTWTTDQPVLQPYRWSG